MVKRRDPTSRDYINASKSSRQRERYIIIIYTSLSLLKKFTVIDKCPRRVQEKALLHLL